MLLCLIFIHVCFSLIKFKSNVFPIELSGVLHSIDIFCIVAIEYIIHFNDKADCFMSICILRKDFVREDHLIK